MRRFCLALILLFFAVTPIVSAHVQVPGSRWPYIYYYSHTAGGWIIERADGSDSFVFSNNSCGAHPDWSPSGAWLLTICAPVIEGLGRVYQGHVVHYDNSLRLTVLDDIWGDDYFQVTWSPNTDDLLLVFSRFSLPRSDPVYQPDPAVYIIDARRDEIIFNRSLDLEQTARWSPDGRAVWIFDEWENDSVLMVPINGDPPITRAIEGERLIFLDDDPYGLPTGITIKHLTEPGELVIHDLIKDEQQHLSFTTEQMINTLWDDNHQRALIYAGSELWALDIGSLTLERIAANVIAPSGNYLLSNDQPYFDLPGWSPNGERALFATQDGTLHLRHADGLISDLAMPPNEAESLDIPRVQWGEDTVFIYWDEAMYIYDLAADDLLTTVTRPLREYDRLVNVAVSSDGRYLAYPSAGWGFQVWDWVDDAKIDLIPNPNIQPSERSSGYGYLNWFPGEDIVFVGEYVEQAGPGYVEWSVASADGRLNRLLDTEPYALPARVDTSRLPASPPSRTGEPALQFRAHNRWTGKVSWSADGRYLATTAADHYRNVRFEGAGDPVRIWDAANGEMVAEFQFGGCPMGYLPDKPFDGATLSYQTGAPTQSAHRQDGDYGGRAIAFDWPRVPGNTVLAMVFYNCAMSHSYDYSLLLWDFAADEVIAEYLNVSAAAFSADSGSVTLGDEDGTVVLTTYPNIDPGASFAKLPTRITHLALSADGARLAVAADTDSRTMTEGELSVWDTGSRTALFQTSPAPPIDTFAISPDSKRLILAIEDGFYLELPTLLNATTGEPITELNARQYAAAFSPDGRYLAGSSWRLIVWDAVTLEEVASFPTVGLDVAWSPDGSRLAVAASFGVYIWDVSSGSTTR